MEIDTVLRIFITSAILAWNVLEGAPLENQYPKALVKLYTIPLWRFVLLVTMIIGAQWSPSVGMMMAFGIFFYVMDMEVTLEKW
jgi:H+/gluconate symporter-like permease